MLQRRHFQQQTTLEQRLADEAKRLREMAKSLPPIERASALRKARQADTAAHINQWLNSPGLRAPV
jgi:hypothetical protein